MTSVPPQLQARVRLLFGNEFDLMTQLTDLTNEITDRQAQISTVLSQLRDTRHELATLRIQLSLLRGRQISIEELEAIALLEDYTS